MVSIFRSEEMTLCQIFLSSEAAFNCLSTLGEIGLAQFKDLNPHVNLFQRRFVNEIRRCDEMETKLKFFERELMKADIEIQDDNDNPPAPQPRETFGLELILEKLDNELREVNSYTLNLKNNEAELIEMKNVLITMEYYCEGFDLDVGTSMSQHLIPVEETKGNMSLGFLTGIIAREKMPLLERMLWRVCRGNAFMRTVDVEQPFEDPATGDFIEKICFIIFVQGEALRTKIKRVCEGSKATLYQCPDRNEDRIVMLAGVNTRIGDLATVLSYTLSHRHGILTKICKSLRTWLIKVRKLKGIYHTMNMFSRDITTKCFVAEAWIPTRYIPKISEALIKATKMSGSVILPIITSLDTDEVPPTFHKVNKFTKAYQKLIDSYGVATYREVNPGLYTTTTFPFLFAVMFGDCGHGMLMASFALWMVFNEKSLIAKKSKNEIWNMFFGGRYIILMMGFFSIYTGAVYNDMFSKSINVFGSKFHVGTNASNSVFLYGESEYMLDPGELEDYDGNPYPFGVDPIWQLSTNKINYLNSYKMKMSIIIGVLHMIFGICLAVVNHVYFKRTINILFDFLPQLILMMGLFGYLCFMILYKWFNFGAGEDFGFDFDHDTRCAPSILILFIDMFLFKFEKVPESSNNATICETAYLYNNQYNIQKFIIVFSILMVPMMLFPKPAILNHRAKKEKMKKDQEMMMEEMNSADSEIDGPGPSKEIKIDLPIKAKRVSPVVTQDEEDENSELFLHQAIHTIEFTLGCVSHTASYLRLWALSLAHAQLAEVLWMMVMAIGLKQPGSVGAIILYCIFGAWAALTVSILVVMEGLSAFLHTLRLHWVEFCSKFYEREGYLFHPYKFKHFVDIDDE